MANIDVTQSDSGRTLKADIGDVITVCLIENPTTGYRWYVQTLPPSLCEEGDNFIRPESSGMGAAGNRVFTFRKLARGHISLSLKLYREWEGGDSTIRDFTLQLDDAEHEPSCS